ncbi:MAG: hypothetical protein E7539_01990 [Ruminococcaceae bacterium]|nr:hypothetical protein [Oscillospiraceae bacterium]
MLKKIFALMLAVMMFAALAVGCKPSNPQGGSSSKPTSEIVSDVSSEPEAESSEMTESDLGDEVGDNSSYWPYPWTIETDSAYFRDDPQATQSVTSGGGVKVYKNPGDLGLMCFSLSMSSTTAYGNDAASRERYFKEVVNEGYFNQYILFTGDNLLKEAKIIAEAGGSFWLNATKSGDTVDNGLDKYLQTLETAVKSLKDAGYGALLNGFFWDEPLLGNKISNEQYLTLTKAMYQKFGLRNFAVFATGEFTRLEGNEDELDPSIMIGKITTHGMQYLTDVGFDAYSVDVREGAPNGGDSQLAIWQKEISPGVVDGKSYYTEHRRLITERAGHPVNYWHFPCAWDDGLYGGLNGIKTADEGYWNAHLDFMAQDVLDYKYPGGLCIYTFRRVDEDTRVCFERRMDLKNEMGGWAVWSDVEKYTEYCKKLRSWCETFSSKRVELTNLTSK